MLYNLLVKYITCSLLYRFYVIYKIAHYLRHNPVLSLLGWAQNGILRFGPTTLTTSTGSTLAKYFSRVELNWSVFDFSDSGKM